MSLATPVRTKAMSYFDLNNESPLPTPPQAMHDLLRNGKVATAVPRSSLGDAEDTRRAISTTSQHRQSSSPSARAARNNTTTTRASGSSRSPSSLAISMGSGSTSNTHHYLHRSALGSQMGILQNNSGQSSTSDLPLKPLRPGALTSSSQRSMSYEVSPKQVNDEIVKMSTRPSYMSLAASASAAPTNHGRESNKENVADVRGHQRRISAVRRISSRRSPSPTSTAIAETAQNVDTAIYRQSSAENDKKQALSLSARGMLKKSSEEVGALYRRRPVEGSGDLSPRQEASDKDYVHLTDEGVGLPSTSQLVTPGFTGNGRVLRSGQAPKHSSALWSVGRSMKRIDRLIGPERLPQRIIASQEEEDDDEDDDEEQKQSQIETADHLESRSKWRDTNKLRLEVQEEDEGLHEKLGSTRAEIDALSSTLARSPREWQHSGSDGSNRRSPLRVPLGADEDDEEDDYMQDDHRFNRAEHLPITARKGYSAKEVEPPAARRGAMHDILAAKIPLIASKRAIAEGGGPHNPGMVARDIPIAAGNDKEVKIDFISQVQQEATRQVGQEHLERLGNKPSKDLETKFNGYKFKKIRKAGEGGFSTVWQVRGPFAAPDPLQPGQYIDVPESNQAYFAMKQVTLKKMEKISREEVLEECNLLQSLAGKRNNEDYILRFFGWKSSTGSLKILLELGEHDFNHILREGRLSRQQIEQYWQQMLEAVHFTHEEGGIVHTDLKPANFLMANGRLKLIDFGIAQKIPVGTIHIKRDAMIGTPNYMAPETVRAVKEASKTSATKENTLRANARVYKAGKASDVWALGCIFYQMVYNRPPFEAFHGDEKLKAILDPKHIIEYPNYRPAPYQDDDDDEDNNEDINDQEKRQRQLKLVDEEMINVMQSTFIYDPQDRVTIPQLLDHTFLRPVLEKTKASNDDQVITISRETLKKMVAKLYEFTLNGELHSGNLDERGDALFDNIRTNQALSR